MAFWRAEDRETRANVRRAARIRRTWPDVSRSMGLAHEHRNPRMADRLANRPKSEQPRIEVPRIVSLEADRYGVTMIVRTARKVGRREFSNAAQALADEWRMRQVWATSLEDDDAYGPGYIELRTVWTDPLTELVKQGVPERLSGKDLERLELGLGGRGKPVYLPIAQGATTTVTGASGYGKTMFARNVVVKLAPSNVVRFVGANGKSTRADRGDYRVLAPRYSHLVASDPWEVNELLRGLRDEMYRRLDNMYDWFGVDEFWQIPGGPTVDVPVIVGTWDECQTYLTTTASKSSDRGKVIADNAEVAEDLTKMGRAAGILGFWMTQKGTDDAIPTGIRDVATGQIAFPVRSRAQEVAGLGEGINEFPEMSPRKILKHKYRGVGTILAEGAEGYERFKTPYTEASLAAKLCEATSKYAKPIPGIEVGRTQVPDTAAEVVDIIARRKLG